MLLGDTVVTSVHVLFDRLFLRGQQTTSRLLNPEECLVCNFNELVDEPHKDEGCFIRLQEWW